MPYWQLFYHLVWATKKRESILTPDVEPVIYVFLRTKAIGLGGVVFALNGWLAHVHMVVAVPPKIAIAKFVGQIKGVASTKFNKFEKSSKFLSPPQADGVLRNFAPTGTDFS